MIQNFILIYDCRCSGDYIREELFYETEEELLIGVNQLNNDKNYYNFTVIFAGEIRRVIEFEPKKIITEYKIRKTK